MLENWILSTWSSYCDRIRGLSFGVALVLHLGCGGNIRRYDGTLILGPVPISDNTFYPKISPSLEAARLVHVVLIIASLWNFTCASAALLPRCLSNFRAIGQFYTPISRLRDFARSYNKTSYWILKRGPGPWFKIKMSSYQHRKYHCGDKTIRGGVLFLIQAWV